MLTLSPGERAGVRASVNTNSTENVEKPKANCNWYNFLWTNRFHIRKVKNMKMDGLQNKLSID